MMRKLVICLFILLGATLDFGQGQTQPAKQVKPDLTGKWELNRAKSDLSDDERYRMTLGERSLTILHHDPELKLSRRFHSGKSDSESESLFYTDGRGENNVGTTAQNAVKSNTRWEGEKLISRYALRRAVAWSQGTVEVVDVVDEWSLSRDGKTLTLKTTLRYMLRGTDAEHSPPFRGYVPRLWLRRVYDRTM
jgi:hypothetical protein